MQKVQVHLAAENSQNTTTLVTNTRVFDGTQFLDGTFDVLFDNSTISSIEKAGTGATADTVVDGTGSTLLPGLIDAHVHLSDVEQLATFAAHGVTTVLDMGTWDPKFVQELRATTSGAHVYASGAPLAGANGGHQHIPGFPADSLIADVEQGIQAVNQRATEGADYLKLILDPEDENGMTAELATALVNAAHEQGLLVIAHTTDLFSYEVGLAAGVDIFTHVPLGEALDENIAPRVKLAIPTITMMQEIAYTNGWPLDGALDSVQELVRGGARIMAGTDANDADGVPANVTFGDTLHEELVLLNEFGLNPAQALAAATSTTAEVFGLADRGVIAPGKRADLVLAEGNPAEDIRLTQDVQHVWVAR